MNNSQHPIMTVTGIRKAAGDFQDQTSGKTIEFSNTVVTVLQNYSERELEQGTKLKALSSLMITLDRSCQPKLQ
jgi:hypothetical protein